MKNTSQHNKNTILNYGKYYLKKKKNNTIIYEKVLLKNMKNIT